MIQQSCLSCKCNRCILCETLHKGEYTMASEIDIHELAKSIRAKRGKRGLRAVAEEIGGVSASTLSRIEQGKVPDLDTFIRLCKWLGVPADRFTTNAEQAAKEDISTSDIVAAHL